MQENGWRHTVTDPPVQRRGCCPFLRLVEPEGGSWHRLLDCLSSEFDRLAGEDPALSMDPEPWVDCKWEHWSCRTPPAAILHESMVGKLFLSGLSYAVDEVWIRWRCVTHVVCCLGRRHLDDSLNRNWQRERSKHPINTCHSCPKTPQEDN